MLYVKMSFLARPITVVILCKPEIKKSYTFDVTLSFFCGMDGTRTRDPMRDRHVF